MMPRAPSQGGSSLSLCALVAARIDSRSYCNLQMADFPRWVDQEDVDSAAMYSAYLSYEHEMRKMYFVDTPAARPMWSGHLFMINHRVSLPPRGFVCPDAPNVPGRSCEREHCQRCLTGKGGYQFRWYSCYWGKFYNDRRRAGSWKAPELDGEPTAFASLRFWECPELPSVSS